MPLSKEAIEQQYHDKKLATRHLTDEPGTTYEPHRHSSVYIFTISGSATIKLGDNPWQQVEPGQEIIIENNQLHEAKVGDEPWEYIFATSPEEMKRQGL